MVWRIQTPVLYFVILMVVVLNIVGCSDRDSAIGQFRNQENTSVITELTVNYEKDPIGIDHTPLFGWRMESDVEGQ